VTDLSVGYRDFHRGRRALVTGGLGFIGSSLAHRLVDLGAEVLLVDAMVADSGGNLFNSAGIEHRVRVNISDVRNDTVMGVLVRDREVIFTVAGQVNHVDSTAQCPVADRLAADVLSLPLHPGMRPQAIEEVAAGLHAVHAAV
jgi:nucleoside-diphosphate-sugar epimerase